MQYQTVNPATGQAIRTWQTMSRDEVLGIADDVAAAQHRWADQPFARREPLLRKLGEVLRKKADEYGRLISTEMGKPVAEARAEVQKCAFLCDVYADNAEDWLRDEPVEADGRRHAVVYQPLGVILSIMPWNFPFWQALRFGVPSLAAGNATILKHARNVSGCALAIEESFRLAGFPENLFRSILADHETTAAVLDLDLVRGVSLTGSTGAGIRIGEQAGRRLKKFVLELGGSDPFIVLPECDVGFAVAGAVKGRMVSTGQSCIAAKRFIVHRSLVEPFTERFAAAMADLVVGDPLDEATQVGAIVDEPSLEELLGQLNDSVAAGARVVTGGERLDRPGFFLAPTVVADVTTEMRVMAEEVFGPIAPVIAFDDVEEAVGIANDSEFGLGGSVWSRDLALGEEVARRLESGTTFVNSIVKSDPRMPFGGVKNSGIGRELSWFGLREFVNVKGLNVYDHP